MSMWNLQALAAKAQEAAARIEAQLDNSVGLEGIGEEEVSKRAITFTMTRI